MQLALLCTPAALNPFWIQILDCDGDIAVSTGAHLCASIGSCGLASRPRNNMPFVAIKWAAGKARGTGPAFIYGRDGLCAVRFNNFQFEQEGEKWDGTEAVPRAPESAHQQRGESPRRTEHWLSVAEGNCVVERRGGEQPEQSIIKKMMNSIRPDALANTRGSEVKPRTEADPEREAATPRPGLRRAQ